MLLRDDQAARDAMQEVFIRALRAGNEFRADASPMTWLYRITTNYCLNSIRDRVRRDEILRGQGPPPEEQPLSAEDRHTVLRLLESVPEDVGVVAVHYFIDEMKQEEIAELLGVSRRYVRDRLDAFRVSAKQVLEEKVEVVS
jgi:RNA polymerase sigma-70 factor (ECF subfamily)